MLDKKREKYNSNSQKSVEEAANRIQYLISKQAKLEAYKFEANIIGENMEENDGQ